MTATINASTTAGVVITPDNSGSIALQVGGVTSLSISTAGVVTLPNKVVFSASGTTDSTFTSGTILPFNTAIVSSSYYSTSTYRFTAPVAGTYMFFMNLYEYSSATGSVTLTKNGSELNPAGDLNPFFGAAPSALSANAVLSGHCMLTLAVNDYIEPRIRTGSSSRIYLPHSTFSGYLIG